MFLNLSGRSKSTCDIASSSVVFDSEQHPKTDSDIDEDKDQKKMPGLSGKHKKKYYMLDETWDMGIENLKMKELDLRSGLQRKGMIHKPPVDNFNKECFEKLDEHQIKRF